MDNFDNTVQNIINFIKSEDRNFTTTREIDDNKKFVGLLTTKMIGSELINGDFNKLNTSYKNILEVWKGEEDWLIKK